MKLEHWFGVLQIEIIQSGNFSGQHPNIEQDKVQTRLVHRAELKKYRFDAAEK